MGAVWWGDRETNISIFALTWSPAPSNHSHTHVVYHSQMALCHDINFRQLLRRLHAHTHQIRLADGVSSGGLISLMWLIPHSVIMIQNSSSMSLFSSDLKWLQTNKELIACHGYKSSYHNRIMLT